MQELHRKGGNWKPTREGARPGTQGKSSDPEKLGPDHLLVLEAGALIRLKQKLLHRKGNHKEKEKPMDGRKYLQMK